jgi:hypothetical protein
VPGTGNPTARRRELGTLLRAHRLARGLTVEEVAAQLLVSPSKISRIETGQRGATARDIRDLVALYELGEQDRRLLTELALEGKQRAWWQPFNLPYSAYVGLEADAVTIRDFNLAIVPGLLQTERYARAMIQTMYPRRTDDAVDQQVLARRERQERVLLSGDGPDFTAIIDEAALRRQVGGAEVMAEQLKALQESAIRQTVKLKVVPFSAGALSVGTNKFIILGFDRPSMPDLVYLESLTGELMLDTEREVREYAEAFHALSDAALPPAETFELIAALERDFRRSMT